VISIIATAMEGSMDDDERDAPGTVDVDDSGAPLTEAGAVTDGLPLDAAPDGPPPFTVRAVLSDVFARYGADPVRLIAVSGVLSGLSVLLSPMQLGRPGPIANPDPIYGILGALSGAVGTATLFALAAGGRSAPLGRVILHALRRSFTAFLALLAIGIGAGGIALVTTFAANLFLRAVPLVHLLVTIAGIVFALWFALRLYLALPGVVADDLGAAEALSQSRAVTRPVRVWVRLAIAGIITLLLFLCGFLGFGTLAAIGLLPGPLFAIAFVAFFSVFTPLVALLIYSAYRRLVAPGGIESATEARLSTFVVPSSGRAARAMAGIILGLGVIGLVGLPLTTKSLTLIGFGSIADATALDRVPTGAFRFGLSSDLARCAVHDQRSVFGRSESFVWMTAFTPATTTRDRVTLRVTQGTEVLGEVAQPAGAYGCLTLAGRESGFPAGTYLFELLVNGEVRASGTVTIT
jgi:hypothetical protein